MSEYTPGPWMVEYTETVGESVYIYPEAGSQNDDAIARLINTSEGMANARLMAASPTMYEALLEADPTGLEDIAAIRTLAKAALNQPSLQGGQKEAIAQTLQQYARFIRVARVALAKAKQGAIRQ